MSKPVASLCQPPRVPGTPTLARLHLTALVATRAPLVLSTLTVPSGDGATTAAHHWVEMSPVRLGPRPLSHRKLGLNLEHVELLVGEAVRVNCLSLTSP